VTVAPPHAIPRRRPLSVALIALVALAACKAGADKPAHRHVAASAAEQAVIDSAGPVVIDAPSGKYAGHAVAGGGTVTGTVHFAGAVTPLAPVPVTKDGDVCGAAIADSAGGIANAGLGNTVVWLEGIRSGKPIPLEKRIELESDHCLLVPRMQAALAGGAVNVLAHDEFRQHLRFVAGGEDEARVAVLLGKDEQVIPTELPLKVPGLVIVRDLDHPWPKAFIAVFDHPYFAVAKNDGSFRIDSIPPGTYTLVAWHERAGRTEQKVTVAANGTAKVDVAMKGK